MTASIDAVPADHRGSARNLVHYVALRQFDLRGLQEDLQELGLSSLGRSESCVLGSLLAVTARARECLALHGDEEARRGLEEVAERGGPPLSWKTAQRILHQHTEDVLGRRPEDRHIQIMVTAPSATEADEAWMTRMLRAGMNVLRVNCAHESEAEWAAVLAALAGARRETGRGCRVLMDLAGPKIRTGPIACDLPIATWKPEKDALGQVTAPAHVIIQAGAAPWDDRATPQLLLDDAAFATIRPGDELRFRDARRKKRALVALEVTGSQIVAEARSRAYVSGRIRVRVVRGEEAVIEGALEVPEAASAVVDVRSGDTLMLTGRPTKGHPPVRRADGSVDEPGLIACTLPDALAHLARGHRVLFDEGRIDAVVEAVAGKLDFQLRVVRTQTSTVKLRPEKGINLPDTEIEIPSLTDADRRALVFVAEHADAVGLSFVRRPEDVRVLHEELDRLNRTTIATVVKIETRAGFEHLPLVLLECLRRPPCAVMIARGDLAVEVGFERLAELQDEILWLCEAAHVPAIWATQVLDTLARTGVPSRAEVTDAAASVAAECVMLNKGPYIEEAVSTLSDILRRMEKHRYKKRSLFRRLEVSNFGERPL